MRYDYPRCKGKQPHEYEPFAEAASFLAEICVLCGDKQVWDKDDRGRVANKDYLRYHIREFAQATGPTSQVFEMLYGKPMSERQLRTKGTNAGT